MIDLLLWAAGIVATGLFSLIGWVITMIFAKFKDHEAVHTDLRRNDNELDKKIDDHRLYAAETFTTKVDIRLMQDQLVSQLNRIEDKLDRKVDK